MLSLSLGAMVEQQIDVKRSESSGVRLNDRLPTWLQIEESLDRFPRNPPIASFPSALPSPESAQLHSRVTTSRSLRSERSNVALRLTVIPAFSLRLADDVDKDSRGRAVGYGMDGIAE